MLVESIIENISKLTRERPMFLHFDSIGLLYLGSSNDTRLEVFSNMLNNIADRGGNVIVPAFSYSFCKGECFDLQNTPTSLGSSHEYLRLNNQERRTNDGIFSYLIFSNNPVFEKYKGKIQNQNCFGETSLLSAILQLDGLVGSIGGVIQSTTEIHHIEKKLRVNYRYDKAFIGSVIPPYGDRYDQEVIFFCRDLDFYKKTLLGSDLSRLYDDLGNSKKVHEVNVDNEFLLDYVAYADIYDTTKAAMISDPYYLLAKRPDMYMG